MKKLLSFIFVVATFCSINSFANTKCTFTVTAGSTINDNAPKHCKKGTITVRAGSTVILRLVKYDNLKAIVEAGSTLRLEGSYVTKISGSITSLSTMIVAAGLVKGGHVKVEAGSTYRVN